jgi:hypothetical protein
MWRRAKLFHNVLFVTLKNPTQDIRPNECVGIKNLARIFRPKARPWSRDFARFSFSAAARPVHT